MIIFQQGIIEHFKHPIFRAVVAYSYPYINLNKLSYNKTLWEKVQETLLKTQELS